MLNLLWQICIISWLIFVVANGQILKNNLIIWSHWSPIAAICLWETVRPPTSRLICRQNRFQQKTFWIPDPDRAPSRTTSCTTSRSRCRHCLRWRRYRRRTELRAPWSRTKTFTSCLLRRNATSCWPPRSARRCSRRMKSWVSRTKRLPKTSPRSLRWET